MWDHHFHVLSYQWWHSFSIWYSQSTWKVLCPHSNSWHRQSQVLMYMVQVCNCPTDKKHGSVFLLSVCSDGLDKSADSIFAAWSAWDTETTEPVGSYSIVSCTSLLFGVNLWFDVEEKHTKKCCTGMGNFQKKGQSTPPLKQTGVFCYHLPTLLLHILMDFLYRLWLKKSSTNAFLMRWCCMTSCSVTSSVALFWKTLWTN